MRLNSFELFATSSLSHFPALKLFLKRIYYWVFYLISYRGDKFHTKLKLRTIEYREHSFFGYFDVPPDNGDQLVLVMGGDGPSCHRPTSEQSIFVGVKDIQTDDIVFETQTTSFNWQQGCRAQWLNQHQFMFNRPNASKTQHNGILINLRQPQQTTVFEWPIQTAYEDKYYLSVNYQRLSKTQPEYGYHDLPQLNDTELSNNRNDGIRLVNLKTKTAELILPISRVISYENKTLPNVVHSLNHCSISPTGTDFLFIHRYFLGSKRVDNFFCYNLNTDVLKPICRDRMVSHFSWIDEKKFLCFFEPEGKAKSYYIVDKDTESCQRVTNEILKGFGDGHPSSRNAIMFSDSYPGRDRMQHLIRHDLKSNETTVLGSFFSPIKYFGEGRCDLHPRLSLDGQKLFFDSVHKGKRKLCYLNLAEGY